MYYIISKERELRMEKLMVEEIRLTNVHREVERDIVMDPTTKFFNKQKSDRPLVATENGFHSDVKQSYNGNNYKDIALYAYSSQHYDFGKKIIKLKISQKELLVKI